MHKKVTLTALSALCASLAQADMVVITNPSAAAAKKAAAGDSIKVALQLN